MNRAVFEIKQSPMGYYFTFKGTNKETQVISCSFSNRARLERCLAKVREVAPLSDIHTTSDPFENLPFFLIQPQQCGSIFSLIGFSGEIIFSSISYVNEEICRKAIVEFKISSQKAAVADHTID